MDMIHKVQEVINTDIDKPLKDWIQYLDNFKGFFSQEKMLIMQIFTKFKNESKINNRKYMLNISYIHCQISLILENSCINCIRYYLCENFKN